MRLVVIDSRSLTYQVYEGRRFLAEFKSFEPLDAPAIEAMRVGHIEPRTAA
jgi:hypothetical protein